jgi:AcrR family transcriptional regulator
VRRDALANREAVLAAAEAVFGATGGSGSTEEVARRAGVGIGTVFRHFPTKQDLIEAAVVRHFDRVTEQARALAATADPGSAFAILVETMVSRASTKIALLNLLSAQKGMTDAAARASRDLRDAVGVVLRQAQRAGAVRADVSIDEVFLLIRGLSQASATAPVAASTLHKAVAVVLDGLAPRHFHRGGNVPGADWDP